MPTPPSLFSEYSETAAEMGSGVPCGLEPIPYCDAKDKAENCEPADVGLLARPSSGPKLPDLEWAALLSLPPLADCPGWAPDCRGGCSYGAGVTVLPIGVDKCKVSCGRPTGAAPPTGFTLGDGGIASPSLGVLAPLDLAPPIAGLRRGAGAFIMGIGLGFAGVTVGGVGSSREGVGAFMMSTGQQSHRINLF